MFQSSLIYFLGIASTHYLSQYVAIYERSPYLLPNRPPIAISVATDYFSVYTRNLTVKPRGRKCSPTEMTHGRPEKVGKGRK